MNRTASGISSALSPPSAPARAERAADAIVHALGVAGALAAGPALVALAARRGGDGAVVAATAVYAASMAMMFVFSAAYHLAPARGAARGVLRRLDHAAIFVKIAGAYTPFAVLLAGAAARPILTGIWAAALAGAALKLAAPGRFERAALALYLALGWAIVPIGGPILRAAHPATFWLLIGGGALYTAGVGVFVRKSMPFQTALWHLMVLTATGMLCAAVAIELARAP
ncbi:PAQR family membrane homeostasis protein TrhA [Oceanicella actignis]|uniref:PAQR family membrane homeostasis protein TrhA n=1 Tax=Oceanicella actignis TaxID=1189325 RepID=UPI0011E8330B|nr:hemolysin III family protein [Oceanicella actignis]TYO85225.1 hemolysin III [Oceanicella actignis]